MLREWLLAMCAAGYVSYSSKSLKVLYVRRNKRSFFILKKVRLLCWVHSIFTSGNIHNSEKVKKTCKTGKGVKYNDSHPCISQVQQGFRPSYSLNLIKKVD